MRRIIIAAIVFVVLFAVTGGILLAYNKHERLMKCDEYLTYNNSISESGKYTGCFKAKNEAYNITRYEYRIEKNTLFITVYGNVGTKEALPVDKDGYVVINVDVGTEVNQIVYYEDEDNQKNISYKKVL